MQHVNLSHEETPKGHKYQYFEKQTDGTILVGSYEYYISSDLSQEAFALVDSKGFVIDRVKADRVQLVNHLTTAHATLWTSTNEIEIQCVQPLAVKAE
jgi:hypothetical protein